MYNFTKYRSVDKVNEICFERRGVKHVTVRANYTENEGPHKGRSGSTVAKYIKLDGTPKIVKHTFKEVVREA